MINFKSELIEKRNILDGNIRLYNSVVSENLSNIKELFKDSGYSVSTTTKNNNSIVLKLGRYEYVGEKFKLIESEIFTYDFIMKNLYSELNKGLVESQLKKTIISIAQEKYIKVEESVVDIKPIDFKILLDKEEDKKKVIYGLFDSVLESNLPSIKESVGDRYIVDIKYKKSSGNILSIIDTDVVNRCCYIKYENVNPHKTLQELTKEEIEEYLKRIIIGFIMEYDK